MLGRDVPFVPVSWESDRTTYGAGASADLAGEGGKASAEACSTAVNMSICSKRGIGEEGALTTF